MSGHLIPQQGKYHRQRGLTFILLYDRNRTQSFFFLRTVISKFLRSPYKMKSG